MIAFEQKHFPFTHSQFEWLPDYTLRYQYRRINKKIETYIPLSYLHTETATHKQTSSVAGFLTLIGFALIFIFAQDYASDPVSWKGLSHFIVAETSAILLAVFSVLYFWHSARKRIGFFFKNGEIAFELIDHKNVEAFKEELKRKSIQATLTFDNHNLELLKTEIAQLARGKMINSEFEAVLQGRLASMTEID